MNRTSIGCLLAVVLAVATMSTARADEADDIQAMIDRARRGVNDLRRLDEQKAAPEEIALLDVWLNDAWRLRGEQKYDEAREVLDRVEVQKDMIREQITAAAAKSEAAALEAKVKAARARVKALKDEIAAATKKKAGMEAKVK